MRARCQRGAMPGAYARLLLLHTHGSLLAYYFADMPLCYSAQRQLLALLICF